LSEELEEKVELNDEKYERETMLNISDGEKQWVLETFMGKVKTKLKNIGETPLFVDEKTGRHYYKLDYNQVSFRKKSTGSSKVMSEDHKEKLRLGREAKKNK
jgi:hypothetical protein